MAEIIGHITAAVTGQMTALTGLARQLFTERLDEFEQRIVERFSNAEKASIQSFADPDFNVVAQEAAKNYARSGDEDLQTMLIELLSSRSRIGSRTRAQLTLNRAIQIAPELTRSDVIIITFIFLGLYARIATFTIEGVAKHLNLLHEKFVTELSDETSSTGYLASCGCATPNAFGLNFETVIYSNYGLILSPEFTEQDLIGSIIAEEDQHLISKLQIRPTPDGKLKFGYFAESDLPDFKRIGFSERSINGINGILKAVPTATELMSKFAEQVPMLSDIVAKWTQVGASEILLTAPGLALGHANFCKLTGENPPLSIWVK